jgi:Uma2 family endonuclease
MPATLSQRRTKLQPATVVLHNISWDFYERFLEETKEQRVRHTYDDGELEIMSPLSMEHEHPKSVLAQLVEVLTEELEIPRLSVGSLTLRRRSRRKGVEPDEGFYIAHEAEMRAKVHYDPKRDPPPDLVIEIDYTSASLPRLPVYAKLGVPEIWHYEDDVLTVLTLKNNGQYGKARRSLAFPSVPLAELQRFAVRDRNVDETTWILQFRAWVRKRCLPKD